MLELQHELSLRRIEIPIVMISGLADVRIAVEAMAHGALTLLEKSFSLDELLGQVRRVLAADCEARKRRQESTEIHLRLASLTPCERDVMNRIVAGQTNREIANDLGLSVRAIEDRRSRLMKKLHVEKISELLLVAQTNNAQS